MDDSISTGVEMHDESSEARRGRSRADYNTEVRYVNEDVPVVDGNNNAALSRRGGRRQARTTRETPEERGQRLESQRQRQEESRARTTAERVAMRRTQDREYRQSRRNTETEEQRQARVYDLRERAVERRLNETEEQTQARLYSLRERAVGRRLNETDAQREEERVRSQRRVSAETAAARAQRRSANALSQQRARLATVVAVENDLGPLSVACTHCHALFYAGEVGNNQSHINVCCNFGNVVIDNKFANFPHEIRSLLEDNSPKALNFRANIRQFNAALAMASMGAQLDVPRGNGPYTFRIHGQVYHFAGPLHPPQGQRPSFGQIYILDTSQACAERLGHSANANCDADVMQELGALIGRINSFAAAFKMMSEVEHEEERAAIAQGRSIAPVRMIFDTTLERDPRRYNTPQANEVAVVYVGEDGDVPATRSIAIHPRTGGLEAIRDIDPICDPLTYPVLFPTGALGWHTELRKRESGRKRTRISQKEYYCHLLQVRANVFNPLLHAGALFQQYVVDSWVKIEQNRLNFHRSNQTALRAEQYQALTDYMSGARDGPPGKRIILSSSFPGSPRAMVQDYQDAMAIVSRYGKPDFFVTMTCNPKWKEIQDNLGPGQTASDRPDLVARVFQLKVNSMFEDLLRRHVLGEVKAYIYVFEWQKRGLPHVHTLLIMTDGTKPRHPNDVDRLVSAELPDPVTEREMYEIVSTTMIHRPCGVTNPRSPCMINGTCSKHFPKAFRNSTNIEIDGYPEYRRREDGRIVSYKGVNLDNRHVVPYNPYLLMRYRAHINVEICAMIEAVKYLFKYVYKGPDRAALRLTRASTNQDGNVVDEIKNHLDARYVCAPEAMHHILGFAVEKKSDTVHRMAVHLPGFQNVVFPEGREAAAIRRAASRDTTLTAWFKLNTASADIVASGPVPTDFLDSRGIRYIDIPRYYTFHQANCEWRRRLRHGHQIGRMYTVSPQEPERYALRLLLLSVTGALSFEDLRTVRNDVGVDVTFATFLEAAKEKGLLSDDSHYVQTLREAAVFQMPSALRSVFTAILAFNEVSDAEALWGMIKTTLAEDFAYHGGALDEAIALAYFDIDERLRRLGKKMADFVHPPTIVPPPRPIISYDPDVCRVRGAQKYDTLNEGQKIACDAILASVDDPSLPRFFFVDGPGGSGKTYLYETIFNLLIGRGKRVTCTAWTGIAANLLPGGRTSASLFKLDIKNNSEASFHKRQMMDARELGSTDVIIWDEASMIPKAALNTVDAVLRDITRDNRPFGGKVLILGGDFRQVLPVVRKGSRGDHVNGCIKMCELWERVHKLSLTTNMRVTSGDAEWIQFLLKVGDGTANDNEGKVVLPDSVMSNGDLVDDVFGQTIDPYAATTCENSILAPKNVDVDALNAKVHERMTGRERVYHSADEAMCEDPADAINYPTEFLNKLQLSRMPPHELKLKEGSVVMLLRNLDVTNGLCNGTRMIVVELGRHILRCKIACGDRKDKMVLIPRIDCYADDNLPFRLRRRQFPVKLSFAMTINKAQGQSFNRIGLWLPGDVFTHGQLYVALSRVRSREGLRVSSATNSVVNVVYDEVL